MAFLLTYIIFVVKDKIKADSDIGGFILLLALCEFLVEGMILVANHA